MDLRALRHLIAVDRAGSVSAASAEVLITQPALSRQLRRLEREVGIELFARHPGGLKLSAAGREFLPIAQRLVAQADAALAAAATIGAGRMKRLSITAPGTTLSDVVAPFLATLRTDDPLPDVRREVPGSNYDVLEHGVDLAIRTAPPPAHLHSLALANLPVWAYVPPGHAWEERLHVAVENLITQPLLLLPSDFHPRRALDIAVEAVGRTYGEINEFETPEVAQALAAAGRGVAVVSDDPRYGLHRVGIQTAQGAVRIRLWAAWSPDHHGSTYLANLANRLREFCILRYGADNQEAPK